MILGWLVFALFVTGCVKLSAETPLGELKVKLDKALEANAQKVSSDQKVANTGEMYLEKLSDLKSEFLDQGSLDGVLEVQDEIRRYKNSGGIPTEFSPIEQLANYQKIYANEIKKIESEEMVGVRRIYNAYENALLRREEELVRMGSIKKAVDVRKERDRVKKVIRKLSQKQVDPMTKKYFASQRKKDADSADSEEDVFLRPEEPENAVPEVENQEVMSEGADALSGAFDVLKAKFQQALVAHWETVASDEQKMYKKYMRELRIREFHYQSQGSLDGVLGIRKEMKRLEEKGALLDEEAELKHLAIVRRNFVKDVKKLKSADRERLLAIYREYLDVYGELERSLVKQRLIEEATAVRKERERVAELITKQAQKDLVLHVFEMGQDAEQ
ncbi:hypothetical protein DDZ13_03770 [Coraliomargarita sinensis]|uniref:Uncharacterized protein n=1 Tax=Coraliomargarita sinensis TaxID=2174842 RepID=A0A317ZJC4_9BACT|nr:hypothetical protein [Coraliomargarita sinensis]PXA05092.1 hypothetical protein DDZ13_03770 [Coraliomargarita sinensis]